MDGAREKIMGKFKEAYQDATVQVHQLETILLVQTELKEQSKRIKELQDVQ